METTATATPIHAPIKSYVLRQGRMTLGQRRGVEEILPTMRFNAATLPALPTGGKRICEIGFGNGEVLLHHAAQHPDNRYIGMEVHAPGVGHLMIGVETQALTNITVHHGDAMQALHNLPDGSLDELWLFFPDPWHKARHNKRRIVRPDFIATVTQKLKVGGVWRLATDWEDYAQQMLALLNAAEGLRNTAADSGYAPRFDGRKLSHFEARGGRLGHGVWDLCYARV